MSKCKFYKEEEYVSYDSGETWSAMGVYKTGDLIENDSLDCGYTPSKFMGTGTSSIYKTFYVLPCDNTSSITSSEVSLQYSGNVVTAEVGNCVTRILKSAFGNCTKLTSVMIPNSVTSIGAEAFKSCIRLSSITIPNSVTTIGDGAFRNCDSLTSIDIPNSVTSIADNTFIFCDGLESITIGSGVISIGTNAFQECYALTSVTIPDNVISIGDRAFYYCTNLTSCTIGSGVTTIGGSAFHHCSGLTSIDIPNSVTSIGELTFYDCFALTSCTIGSGVTSIGNYGFYQCSGLTSIDIPNSVTSIGELAFYGCKSLSSCTIGSGVTSISGSAFGNCSGLTSITCLATTPPTMGDGVFDNTNNCPIYVPCESVNTYKSAYKWSNYVYRIQAIQPCSQKLIATLSNGNIYSVACDGDSELTSGTTKLNEYRNMMKNAVIGDCVTSIGVNAFNFFGALTSVTMPDSVTSIGNLAFYGCTRLTSCSIPSGVTSIGESAFESCSGLTSVTIPSGVTSISDRTFRTCKRITSIEIPSGVTSIGRGACSGCTSLTSITVNAITPPTLDYYVFNNTNNCPIYVPCASVDAYKSATNWSTYASRIQAIPNSCSETYRTISGTPYCSGYDKYVDVYSQVSYDSGSTWQTTATTPTLVEVNSQDCGYVPPTPTGGTKFLADYRNGSFYSEACDSSSELTKTTTRPSGYQYTAMTSAVIGDCNTSIGYEAFYRCSGLTSVTIPDSVTSIGERAFASCFVLSSVTLPSGVTSIGESAFDSCSGFTSVTIPSGVTSIGYGAFFECKRLTSITILATTPPTIEEGASEFNETNNCPIYVPSGSVNTYKTATNWSEYASRIQAIP